MTPEQQIRLTCLSWARELGGCADCILDAAADFAAFVIEGEGDTGTDTLSVLNGEFGRRLH
jgi:hypothetical protein